MINKEPAFTVNNGESLVSLDYSSTESNDNSIVLGHINAGLEEHVTSKDTLIQAADEAQDTTKPYRIVFRGELVHD